MGDKRRDAAEWRGLAPLGTGIRPCPPSWLQGLQQTLPEWQHCSLPAARASSGQDLKPAAPRSPWRKRAPSRSPGGVPVQAQPLVCRDPCPDPGPLLGPAAAVRLLRGLHSVLSGLDVGSPPRASSSGAERTPALWDHSKH